jgi:glycosyltransferase involved in cell wall biosynthesis
VLISPINLFTKAIFAVGEGAISSYRSFGYKKPIFNTPYSINNTRFGKKSNYKHPEQVKIIFLSSGSLIYRKGYDLAIQAFNLLDDRIKSKVEYWILGDGPLLTYLQSLRNPGLTVRLMGFVEPSDIPKYFNSASVFMLTSRYDGWGVVVNEAIAAGLALIVTNTCGAAEYVNNDNGFVVKCDAQEISEKISYLVLNPKISVKFSDYNIQLAQSISSDSISRRLMEHISKF